MKSFELDATEKRVWASAISSVQRVGQGCVKDVGAETYGASYWLAGHIGHTKAPDFLYPRQGPRLHHSIQSYLLIAWRPRDDRDAQTGYTPSLSYFVNVLPSLVRDEVPVVQVRVCERMCSV